MKLLFSISAAVILCTAIFSETGCKKSSDYKESTPAFQVSLKTDATLGKYLTDKEGRTLYFFSNDPNGMDNCTGQCQLYWPVFTANNFGASMLGPGLDIADFDSVNSASGKSQITYKGWPLYYYAPDGANREAPGMIQGDNKNNVWFVAKPDYSIMIVNAQLVGNDGVSYKSDYTVGNGTTAYFADAYGRTLYTFSHDSANSNKFTVSDTTTINNYNSIWPIYSANNIIVPSALDKTQFGSITVFGHTQLTYRKWPLYYFYLDTTPGSNKGVAFPQAPAPPAAPCIWPVATQNQASAPN